jgi:uncharacterized integral membrane protein
MTRQDPDSPKPPSDEPAGGQASPPQADDPAVARARDDQERHIRRARQGRVTKVLIALIVLVILITFILVNSQGVEVDFVFFTRRPPLIWIMLGCAVLGGIVGYIIGRPGKELRRFRDRRAGQKKS